jgi:hypothetical protein
MSKEIVLTTSSLNSQGFRVLSAGGDLEQYKKNPILLWMHIRPTKWSGNERLLPIGKMENIRIDGDKIIATPVFDDEDEFAVKIQKKYDKGMLNMCSIGIDVVESSNDLSYLLPGQRYETVTKWKLTEVSMVDIGSNDDALPVVLYKNGNRVELSNDNQIIPLLKINQPKMKKLFLALGLPETATEDEVLNAINLSAKAYKDEIARLQKEFAETQKANIISEVDAAIKGGKFTADKKQHFIELGEKVGLESLKITLASIETALKPKDVINHRSTSKKEESVWAEMSDDEKTELRAENPEQYKTLFKKEYGFEPKLD